MNMANVFPPFKIDIAGAFCVLVFGFIKCYLSYVTKCKE